MTLLESAIDQFEPNAETRCGDWFADNIQTDKGRPYDRGAYPHLDAPGGPCDAADDPYVLTITLQWASRLGKTFFGQCLACYYASQDPRPMMFASSDRKLATDVISRTYRMIDRCKPLRHQLMPKHLRKQDRVELTHCTMYVAWSRSVSTLADKSVQYGHANEVSKWEQQTTSREGDPVKLFSDRGKEFPTRKYLYESTPQEKRRCRVEKHRLASTNCQLHVPCPHCKKYQVLDFTKGEEKWGVKWDKDKAGKSDKELSRNTASYVCRHCLKKIEDHDRPWVMRRGVWVPDGCTVIDKLALRAAEKRPKWEGWDRAMWIKGKPMRDGPDAGYQLSSLYALSLGWGDIAAEFVGSKGNTQDLRNFINQWLGQTWETKRNEQTWEQLGKKMATETPMFSVPDWASILTVSVDIQREFIPWSTIAWGPGRTHQTIAYGEVETLDELLEAAIERWYVPENGGDGIQPSITLIDSGFKPEGVYDFCIQCQKKKLMVLPCKGSSKPLDTEFTVRRLGKRTSTPGMTVVFVDTIRSQAWIERILHDTRKGDDGCAYLFHDHLRRHQDFLEQLLNDSSVTDLDTTNNEKEVWQRINEHFPNDYRDIYRYAYAAMLLWTRGGPIRPRDAVKTKRSAVVSAGVSRRDGRRWAER